MSKKQSVQFTAECIRGDHGTAARLSAGVGYVYSGILGTVLPGAKNFVNDIDAELETQEEQRIMDLLTLLLGKTKG